VSFFKISLLSSQSTLIIWASGQGQRERAALFFFFISFLLNVSAYLGRVTLKAKKKKKKCQCAFNQAIH
jgi:hypothetical protein